MSLTDVSNILRRELELLELLLLKLQQQQLLLASGRTRWLPHATRAVEMVLREVRRAELVRAVEVDAVAVSLGVPSGVSLRELAEVALPPWGGILLEHRNAFLAVTDEISVLVRADKALPAAGRRTARESLTAHAEPEDATRSSGGQSVPRSRGLRLLDEVIQ